MKVDIYQLKPRSSTYLFVPHQGSIEEIVSKAGLPATIAPVFFKTKEIAAGEKLIGASANEIIAGVTQHGFHIQRTRITVSEGGAALGGAALGASLLGPAGAIVGAVVGAAIGVLAERKATDGR